MFFYLTLLQIKKNIELGHRIFERTLVSSLESSHNVLWQDRNRKIGDFCATWKYQDMTSIHLFVLLCLSECHINMSLLRDLINIKLIVQNMYYEILGPLLIFFSVKGHIFLGLISIALLFPSSLCLSYSNFQ